MSILAGPVAFIDDELERDGSQAHQLLQDIRATGRPVASATGLPQNPEAWIEQWQSLAFVVVDWDLSPGSGSSTGASELGQFARERLFDFVRLLMDRLFCPIFIISAEDTNDIARQLVENGRLLTQAGNLDPRIAVFAKDVLMGKLIDHLEEQIRTSPSLSALKAWEAGYDSAKNRLFVELNQMEPDWPAYIWKTAVADSVDPSHELASVISANLLSRFDPVLFDGDAITSVAASTNAAARAVLHGRTFVGAAQLPESMVMPGDLFRLAEDDPEIWMNVSPACQTVGRSGDPIQLHLLRGHKVERPASQGAFKTLVHNHESPNKILIHTLIDEDPYVFEFGRAQFCNWEDIRATRIGRLLPPYVTRVQQMHGAYIQSEGLPMVNASLYLGDS